MEIEFSDEISFADYNDLREKVGWEKISQRQFDIGIPASCFITVGKADGKTISVARAVGDGAYHIMLVDVIVSPDFQGNGIGRQMVERFKSYLALITEKGETTMAVLVAAKNKEPFYKKFGFIERPTDDRGAGMYMFYRNEENNV